MSEIHLQFTRAGVVGEVETHATIDDAASSIICEREHWFRAVERDLTELTYAAWTIGDGGQQLAIDPLNDE